MIIDLTAQPTKWDGTPLGFINDNPRQLKSFLVQALAEAQTAPTVNGQRTTQDPESLLKRFLLASKLQTSDGVAELTTDEFRILEECIASLFKEAASVMLIGCLHGSIGETKSG